MGGDFISYNNLRVTLSIAAIWSASIACLRPRMYERMRVEMERECDLKSVTAVIQMIKLIVIRIAVTQRIRDRVVMLTQSSLRVSIHACPLTMPHMSHGPPERTQERHNAAH